MTSLEHQIKLLHQSLIERFQEIKEENENIKCRLAKIEEKLCGSTEKVEENKLIAVPGICNYVHHFYFYTH